MTIMPAIVLFLAAALSTAPPPSAKALASIEHLNWALEHVHSCREELFGDPESFRSAGAEGLVVVLRYIDAAGFETQAVLEKRGGHPPTIHALVLGNPLVEQMARLHKIAPDDPPQVICGRIESRPVLVADSDVTESLVNELRTTTIRPVFSAPLPFHGDSYKIWLFSSATHAYFEFLGLPSSEDPVPPLQAWSDRVLSVCHSNESSPP